MVAYQSCVNMNDILRAKQNVFQVTGSPMMIWLIVSSIGQVALECRPSVGDLKTCWSPVGRQSITTQSIRDRYSVDCRSSIDRYVDRYSGQHYRQ